MKRTKIENALLSMLNEIEMDIKKIKNKKEKTSKDDKNRFALKQKAKILLNELAQLKANRLEKNIEKTFSIYLSKDIERFKKKIQKIISEHDS